MTRARVAVIVEAEGPKLIGRMHRPSALNAQNDEVRELLVDAERLETDPELLVAIVHRLGGRAFSAGASLKEVAATATTGRPAPEHSRPTALRTIKRLVHWGADMSAEQAEKLAFLANEADARALEPNGWERAPP